MRKALTASLCTLALLLAATTPQVLAKYVHTVRYDLVVTTLPPSLSSEFYYYNSYYWWDYEVTEAGYYAIQLWGGDGGPGYGPSGDGTGGPGGKGAHLTGYLWLEADDILYLSVGNRGAEGKADTSGSGGNSIAGAEGGHGNQLITANIGSGGGGAATVLYLNGTATANILAVAGGGGGGGVTREVPGLGYEALGGSGGNAGSDIVELSTNADGITGFFMPGQDGGQGSSAIPTGGSAGTADASGIGGGKTTTNPGYDSIGLAGGEGRGLGGGGGGGWYGGGGGGGVPTYNDTSGIEPGGGGGGSSFISHMVGNAGQLPSALWSILPDRSQGANALEGWGYAVLTKLGPTLPPASTDALTFDWLADPDEGLAEAARQCLLHEKEDTLEEIPDESVPEEITQAPPVENTVPEDSPTEEELLPDDPPFIEAEPFEEPPEEIAQPPDVD